MTASSAGSMRTICIGGVVAWACAATGIASRQSAGAICLNVLSINVSPYEFWGRLSLKNDVRQLVLWRITRQKVLGQCDAAYLDGLHEATSRLPLLPALSHSRNSCGPWPLSHRLVDGGMRHQLNLTIM